MTARTLAQLQADNENIASIETALESLDEIDPPPEVLDAAKQITELRNELLQELKTLRDAQPQRSLF